MNYKLLLVCLLFSGFSGLAYELLWVRLLSFTFGSSTVALSTVLAVFFGGLSLGALISGGLLHRIKKPVLFYAIIELFAGLAGWLLYPVLLTLPGLFATIATGNNSHDFLVRIVVSIIVLIVPTMLMGMTLPIVCKAAIVDNSKINRGISLIYGINTLGAFAGAYFVTYHLLPHFGIKLSIVIAVCANGVAAMIACYVHFSQPAALSNQMPRKVSGGEQVEVDSSKKVVSSKILLLAFLSLLSGFAFILFEVVWSRIFSILLGGTIYGIGAVLICFLIGIGLGSLFSTRVSEKVGPALGFVILQLLAISTLILFIRTILPSSYLLGAFQVVGDSVKIGQHFQLGIVFLMIGIPILCSGASFPLLVEMASKNASRVGKNLSILYASNTLGCILSSLVVGFYLLPKFGSGATFFLGGFILVLMIISAGLLLVSSTQRKWGLIAIAISLLLITRFPQYSPRMVTAPVSSSSLSYQAFKQVSQNAVKRQVFFHEGIVANVLVSNNSRYGKGLSLNGLGQGGLSVLPPTHVLESTLMAAIPNLFVKPDNVLVVGLGAGVTVDVLRQQGGMQIDVVELEPSVVDAVDVLFAGKSPLNVQDVSLSIGDARNYLLINAKDTNNQYDIITSMPAHPWVASSLFTKEFFIIAKDNLTDQGVFCCWFGPSSNTPWDKVSKVLMRTFASVFQDYVVFAIPETGAFYLVGGKNKLKIDLDRFLLFNKLDIYKNHDVISKPEKLLGRIYATGSEGVTEQPVAELFNTDDNAFVEVQVPLMMYTNIEKIESSFLPREYAPADIFIGENIPKSFYLNLQEEQMRTPGGNMALIPISQKISHKGVEYLINSSDAGVMFSEQAIQYLKGRIALLNNKQDEARIFLSKATRGVDKEISYRADKWLLFSFKEDERDYSSYLQKAVLTDDVFVERLSSNIEEAFSFISQDVSGSDNQLIIWMANKIVFNPNNSLTMQERDFFISRIKPIIANTIYINLAQLGAEFSEKYNFSLLVPVLEQRVIFLKNKKANQLYQQGLFLAREKKYREAKEKFLGSINLFSMNLYAIERYFFTLLRLNEETVISHEINRLSSTNKREILVALATKVKKDFMIIEKQTKESSVAE